MSYAYNAAMWCDECAREIIADLESKGIEDTGDSNEWPQQCNSDEADCPQHCDGCQEFLQNALTSDGEKYVHDAIVESLCNGDDDSVAITEWAPFYGFEFSVDDCDLCDDGTLDTVIEICGRQFRYDIEIASDYRDPDTGVLDFDEFCQAVVLDDINSEDIGEWNAD